MVQRWAEEDFARCVRFVRSFEPSARAIGTKPLMDSGEIQPMTFCVFDLHDLGFVNCDLDNAKSDRGNLFGDQRKPWGYVCFAVRRFNRAFLCPCP